MDASPGPDGSFILHGERVHIPDGGCVRGDHVSNCEVSIHAPRPPQARGLPRFARRRDRPSGRRAGATCHLRPERVGGSLVIRDTSFTYTGPGVCVLVVEHGPLVPWAAGDDPDSTVVFKEGCTFNGKFELHVAGQHTRLAMEGCAAAGGGALGLRVTEAARADLKRVNFGEGSSGVAVADRRSHCTMHECSVALALEAVITVRRRGRAVLTKCSITGDRCITVSTEAALTVSHSTGVCATGDFAVLVASRAVVDIAASTLSANPALESAAALVVRAGASAVASASTFTGASGVAATSSTLKMLQCGASGLDYAVRARAAHVHICDGCILHARGCAAVALEEGCNAVVTDSELHSTGHAALAAVASIVAAARNSMTLRASGRFCAGIVLNNLRNGSAFYGNTLQGTAEHALLQFVHAGQRDVAAVAAGGLLQHPRMSECDVLAERCAAHRTSDMLEDRERQDEVLWLRKLGARENLLEHNLSLAAATAGLLVGLPFDGMCALLRWVWKYLAVAGDFATHHIIEPMSQAASAATALLATTKTDVNGVDVWCVGLSLAVMVAMASAASVRDGDVGLHGAAALLAQLRPSEWSQQVESLPPPRSGR